MAQEILASESNNVQDVIASITVLATALDEAVAQLPFRLDKKVADIVAACIRSYVDRDLAVVQGETLRAVDMVVGAADALDGCKAAVEVICQSIASFLENLHPLLDAKWSVQRDCMALVRQVASKLAGLFLGLSHRALEAVGKDSALVLASLLVMLEKRGVPMGKEGLAALAMLAQAHPSAIEGQFRAVELVGVLHSAADALLQSYARGRASHLERLMVRSVEAANWMSAELTSARQPRLVVSLVVDEVKAVDAAVGRLFGAEAEGSSLSRKPSVQNSAYYRGGVGQEEMARMFNEKIRIYDRVEFSGQSVVALLVRCVLKAWYESLRQCVLSKHALHQMQLDAFALRSSLAQLLSPDALRVADLLLREVEASAEDRCVEPQPLNAAVIQQIMAASDKVN